MVESPSRPAQPQGTASGRKTRLLHVDDNKINLQMLLMFVRKKGYGEALVELAEDGAEAFDIFMTLSHKHPAPDIVFMDVSK